MKALRNLLLTFFLSLAGFAPNSSVCQVVMSGGVRVSGGVTVSGYSGSGTWSDLPRRATVAIGQISNDQVGVKRFTTGGAGVVIRDARNRMFLATARHVFDEPSKKWAPETLQIRGWRDERTDRYKDFGSVLPVRSNGKPLFIASTKFDLAIIPVTQDILNRLADDNHIVTCADPTSIAGVDETYDGADVFILGFPGLVGDQYQQRALMRAGIIAWTDSSGPVDHEFLVDARIFPGNSGGPVFSSAAGMTRDAGVATGRPIKLLGLVSQTINAKPELVFGVHLPDEAMVIGAAGVGVIEPAHELLDLMALVP
jgi:Trypsin-like peptidase domain